MSQPMQRLTKMAETTMVMDKVKQLSLPNVTEDFMKNADVLLVLDDGVGILCHSQILSLYSAVFCNMLADVTGKHGERVKIPLADFTEAQCSALLKYFYSHGVSSPGAAFEGHDAASHDAAATVARFAHIYDMPHALRHVQAYVTAFMAAQFPSKLSSGKTGEMFRVLLPWAVMADKYNMLELCGHCERALVMHWEAYQDSPDLAGQLSSGAIQRVAKGLTKLCGLHGPLHSPQHVTLMCKSS